MTKRPIFFVYLILFLSFLSIEKIHAEENTHPLTEKTVEAPLLSDLEDQPTEEGSPFLREFFSMLMTLGLIIVLMILLGWLLKRLLHQRMVSANKGSLIQIIERRSLTPKTAIYVLQVAGKNLIVGESPQGLHSLGELSGEVSTSQEQGAPEKSFRKILEKGDA